jgi:hypothetical protein
MPTLEYLGKTFGSADCLSVRFRKVNRVARAMPKRNLHGNSGTKEVAKQFARWRKQL